MAKKQRKLMWPVLAIVAILAGGFALLPTRRGVAAEKAGAAVPSSPASPGLDQNMSRLIGLASAPPLQGNGYVHRRTIIIDYSKVPLSEQSNFPVLISGAYPYLATVGNGGNVQNASGFDVIFTTDQGCNNKLTHEVEKYDAGTGAVSYWVK